MIRELRGICALEGHNGCNIQVFNAMAIELAARLGLPFTGGSDAHAPEEVGSCFTEFEECPTHDNLVRLLREGRYTGKDTRKVSQIHFFRTGNYD